jgi:hypothetical protein
MANGASCFFEHWEDTGSTNASRSITISADTTITAVHECGAVSAGGGRDGGG